MKLITSLKGKKPQRFPPTLYIFLLLLILFSVLGLDYINWKKGEKSYLFSSFSEEKKASQKNETLLDIILQNLFALGISPDAINQYVDNESIYHFMVDTTMEKYNHLKPLLEYEFKKVNFIVLKKEEQLIEEKYYSLWEIGSQRIHRLTILFSCQIEKHKIKEKSEIITAKNRVAIIVDDMGYNLEAIKDICSLKEPMTIAIIPFSPLANETAHIANQNNLEVILHLPLESLPNPKANNNMKGLIHTRMREEDVIKTLDENIRQVPFIVGVNNHMGSKVTTDAILMRIILGRLKIFKLYFIDSLTTGRSVAFNLAQEMEIPSASRHVFLDAENDEEFIKSQLIELFRLAQKNGMAVGICHPWSKTLRVLAENFYLIEEYDIEPVFASEIVQ